MQTYDIDILDYIRTGHDRAITRAELSDLTGIDDRTIRDMYYIDGVNAVNQTEVAKMIHLERSTISKKIDRYLQLSHKSHESHI